MTVDSDLPPESRYAFEEVPVDFFDIDTAPADVKSITHFENIYMRSKTSELKL